MSEEILKVGFNAKRVCEAIARIGYEPHSAIMDLVDNSVTAGATDVRISLMLVEGKSLHSRNSVRMYQIVDDGWGMNEEGVLNAFTLGSDQKYPAHSLSKYGMGLKSAGLSLGTRISIISKKSGTLSARYTFDTNRIDDHGLAISKRVLSDEEQKAVLTLLSKESGTIIEIEGCEEINHSSPNATIGKLKERLGVVYCSFLSREQNPLQLFTRVCVPGSSDNSFSPILAKDILFTEQASHNTGWAPDSYDYISPFLVLDQEWNSLRNKKGEPLKPPRIQAVAFPQAQMASEKSPLSPEGKQLVNSYGISRDNKGFFIYRNGRLIRWGDDLERLVGKDDINIRLRIELEDVHDDVLHVDVSKQRLEIDDELRTDLSRIINKALKTAKEIRDACQIRLKGNGADEEGRSFSVTARNVPEDDPSEIGKGATQSAVNERKRAKADEAAQAIEDLKTEEQNQSGEVVGIIPADVPKEFKKVRYSEKVPHEQVWKPYYDAKEGVFVCINRNHPFYDQFISRFGESSVERLAIEALIFSLAVAENNVSSNEVNLDQEMLDRIFRRFHKNVYSWLSDWVYENTDIE